jgi:hypothetical protein
VNILEELARNPEDLTIQPADKKYDKNKYLILMISFFIKMFN